MQDINQRMKALEDRVQENEIILYLLWGGLRLILRALTAVLANRQPVLRELLERAVSHGLTKFDHEATRQAGHPELARLQEEINRKWERNEQLYKFQTKMSEGFSHAAPLPAVSPRSGVVAGARQPKDEPEMGR